MESFKREFPKDLYDFECLSRPIEESELSLADKEFLIKLVVILKRKELQNEIKHQELLVKLDNKLTLLENSKIHLIQDPYKDKEELKMEYKSLRAQIKVVEDILTDNNK